jgi:hypothetical protein
MTTVTGTQTEGMPIEPAAEAETIFYVDTHDPLANFFRNKLHFDWIRIWFVALLYFGVLEKLILPYLGGYLNLSVGIRQWVPHVEALLTGFIEFPIFLSFYLWSGRSVVGLFESFQDNQNFKDPRKYHQYYQDVLKSFQSKWYSIISLCIALLAVSAMHFVIWGKNSLVPPWFGDLLYMRVFTLFNIGLVAYCVSQSIIREGLLIISLRKLWQQMDDQLEIHPYHQDEAGGLGMIGQHGVSFLLFVVVLMLFILMATIFPAFVQQSDKEPFSIRLWSPILIVIWISYLVLIPVMLLLLFWPAHGLMLKKRAECLSIYSTRLDEKLAQANKNSAEDPKKVADVLEEVNKLKDLRAVILADYPVWPVNVESKRMIGFTTSLPTLYSAVTFIVGVLS